MKTNIYTVYDRVGEEAGAPFLYKTDALAKRCIILAFRQSNRPELKMDDHWVYRLGTFDTETMKIKLLEEPIRIDMSYNPDDYIEVTTDEQTIQ